LFERLFGRITPNPVRKLFGLLKAAPTHIGGCTWGVHMGGGVANLVTKSCQKVIKKSISVPDISNNICLG
jgi:hypothetical protein